MIKKIIYNLLYSSIVFNLIYFLTRKIIKLIFRIKIKSIL
jgi:uncharacterized membrane protein